MNNRGQVVGISNLAGDTTSRGLAQLHSDKNDSRQT
jgi:hypothetical protein